MHRLRGLASCVAALLALCGPAVAAPDAVVHIDGAAALPFALPVTVRCDGAELARLAGGSPPSAAVAVPRGSGAAALPVAVGEDRISIVLAPGAAGSLDVDLYLRGQAPAGAARPPAALKVTEADGVVTVAGDGFTVVHHPRKMSGLPSRIAFAGGRTFENFVLNDRLHDPSVGGFLLREDPDAKVRVLARGPAVAAVEVSARYMQGAKPAPGAARALYRFTYFAGSPLVRVEADVAQDTPRGWNELHLVEINFPDAFFTSWAAGEPRAEGRLAADKSSHGGASWAALVDGDHALGLVGASATVYDGRGEYGTYLHGPWVRWDSPQWHGAAWLWIGRSATPVDAIARAATTPAPAARLTTPEIASRTAACERRIGALPAGPERGRLRWLLELVRRRAAAEGRLAEAAACLGALDVALEKGLPFEKAAAAIPLAPQERWTFARSGGVGLLVAARTDRMEVLSLYDFGGERELLAPADAPLWELAVQLPDRSPVRLDNRSAWRVHECEGGGTNARMVWRDAADERLRDLTVTVTVALDGPRSRWHIQVTNAGKTVALREITFPNLALAASDQDAVIAPFVSGTLRGRPLSRRLTAGGEYPSGWLSMQCAGLVGPAGGTYVGVHDPRASTKRLESDTGEGHLRIAWKWPAPDSGVAGGAWQQPGELVVQPFRGDWFDFALLYRAWVEAEAPWWPRGPQQGRPDTPDWMKDVAVWAITGGDADSVVKSVKPFAEYLGVPTALHWYNWHQIPFDNDYPHYFPPKDGFADGVKALQQAGVRVMPYINGRLWDTDLEDFKTAGLAAATKAEDGAPYTEEYGSGQKLAPMCPTTALWRRTVSDIVLRLLGPECNVDGVYIDQVAAAAPRLCFDKTHGHPPGGGCWWTEGGYWPMLRDLRARIAADRPGKMITTECNAEPYVNLFDGYLTWHFQEDEAIPLFAAVYGGRVQLFSRAYQGDSWKGLAMRMKTAQALVWGEQLGWISPDVVKDPVAGPFLRRLGRLRYALRECLARGRMARPPRVTGDGATVTADWQWSGKRLVTTPAVESGAWQAPDGRVVLLFVNVDEKPHAFDLHFRPADYGFAAEAPLRVTARTGEEAPGAGPAADPTDLRGDQDLHRSLEPFAAVALEIGPKVKE